MISDILANGPAVLAWTAVAYKLATLRRGPHDPAARAYLLTLTALASALTVLAHPVYLTVDRLAGIPNLARFLGHGFILVTSWSVQSLLFYLNYSYEAAQSRVHRLGIAMVVALSVMALLFGLAPVDEETLQFMTKYADAPFIFEYWLVFLSYLGVALVNVIRLDVAYAARTDNPSLRLGLRTVALGGLIGLGYVANEGLYVVGRRVGFGYPLADKDIVTTVLVAGGTSLMIIGSTMPAWGPVVGVPVVWRWFDRYGTLRRLYPLWNTLYQSSPDIALSPSASPLMDVLSLRDLNLRLYRRVIEIRDGLLTLRPFVDPRVRVAAMDLGRAAGLSGDELTAVAEAATIAAAIRAKSRGQTMEGSVIAAAPGGSDLNSEAAFLAGVASAYRSSPIVREVLDRLDRAEIEGGLIKRGPQRRW